MCRPTRFVDATMGSDPSRLNSSGIETAAAGVQAEQSPERDAAHDHTGVRMERGVARAVEARGAERSPPALDAFGREHDQGAVHTVFAGLGEIADREADDGQRAVRDDGDVGGEVVRGGAELRRPKEVGGRVERQPERRRSRGAGSGGAVGVAWPADDVCPPALTRAEGAVVSALGGAGAHAARAEVRVERGNQRNGHAEVLGRW